MFKRVLNLSSKEGGSWGWGQFSFSNNFCILAIYVVFLNDSKILQNVN